MRVTLHPTTTRLLPLLALLLLVVSSCGTRHSVTRPDDGRLSKAEVIRTYSSAGETYPLADARGKLTVSAEGKGDFSSGYRLSLYPSEALVLSLRPMGLFEAARLTVSPDRLIVLDKMDRYGVDETVDRSVDLPEQLLEGKWMVSPDRLAEMPMIPQPEGGYLFGDRDVESYTIDSSGHLTAMTQTLSGGLGRLESSLGDFVTVEGYRPLARQIDVRLYLHDVPPVRLSLSISSYDTTPSLRPDTVLPSGYKQLPLRSLLSLITAK